MKFGIDHLVAATFIFNAVILSVLLMLRHKKQPAAFWLGLLMLALTAILIDQYLVRYFYWNVEGFTLKDISPYFVIGPLIYSYLYELTQSNRTWRLGKWMWAPFILFTVYQLSKASYALCADTAYLKTYFFDRESSQRALGEFLVFDGLAILYNLYFMINCLSLLKEHRIRLKRELSFIDNTKSLLWHQRFIQVFIVLLISWTGYHLTEIFSFPDTLSSVYYIPHHIFLATSLLVFGYQGLMTPEIFTIKRSDNHQKQKRIPDAQLQELSRALLEHIEEKKLFLLPDLRLSTLAESIELTSHQVSEILTLGLESNFYDLINSYRIEEVKAKLQDKSLDHLTILSLAYDSGFNSKNSFYKNFKKVVGVSPSLFRAQSKA